MTPCSDVVGWGGACCLHPEDVGNMTVQNAGVCMLSQVRRQWLEFSSWKSQVSVYISASIVY